MTWILFPLVCRSSCENRLSLFQGLSLPWMLSTTCIKVSMQWTHLYESFFCVCQRITGCFCSRHVYWSTAMNLGLLHNTSSTGGLLEIGNWLWQRPEAKEILSHAQGPIHSDTLGSYESLVNVYSKLERYGHSATFTFYVHSLLMDFWSTDLFMWAGIEKPCYGHMMILIGVEILWCRYDEAIACSRHIVK